MKITKQKLLQYCGLLGILGIIFYFLHVFIGGLIYEGYNPVKQAISDLTANGAPSRTVAIIFTALYGIFTFAFLLAFYIFFRKKGGRIFSLGILLLLIMQAITGIGFTAFPLSEAGYADTFQDIMHIVTTVTVVVLSVAALTMLAIGFLRAKKGYKPMGIITIVTLFLMMLGSVLSGAVPAVLGIAERISIYSLQLYIMLLAVWMLCYKDTDIQKSEP